MNLNEYQKQAMDTAIYPRNEEGLQLMYCAPGLAGEAGEVANKVKKVIRDHGGQLSTEKAVEIMLELGDCLWYLAALSHELGTACDLELIAQWNLSKLRHRKEEGQLQGEGDKR